MMFTIEFFRIRKEDNARAMLDRITHIASDLESAKVKAKSLFETLNMPQNPDGCISATVSFKSNLLDRHPLNTAVLAMLLGLERA
jgi:hypothetical protein